MEIIVKDSELRAAAAEGVEAFAELVKDKIVSAAGGTLNAEAMAALSPTQVTLWAYFILRNEVMDGGFIQLIYNGYGPFFFKNPFAKALRQWGVERLPQLVRKGQRLFEKYGTEICRDCTDEEFMAMFEQYPQFDELDDEFVEIEEETTAHIARYVDEHLEDFVKVES